MPNVLTRGADYSGLSRSELTDIVGFGSGAGTAAQRRADRLAAEAELARRFPVTARATNGMDRSELSQASASSLNSQAPIQEVQRNVVADNRVVPIAYGHTQLGGLIFALDYSNDTFTVGYLLCQGEIGGVLSVWADGEAMPEGVRINTYTGAAGQGVDPLLSGAILDYADTLDGLAYIVIQYAGGVFQTWPQIVAEIQGKLVWDPRAAGLAFTKNSALHLADFLGSSEYGPGYTVDESALIAAANACDDTTGTGEARRESFMVLDTPRSPESYADIMRTYAGCFLVYRAQTVYLVPDRPSASVATFTASDIVDGSMRIRKKSTRDLPTVIQVMYTDTSGNEWRERPADEVAIPGPRRVSRIRLPGITRHSQAYREAVERLNKLQLSDLEVDFVVFDNGLAREVGDRITASHPYGLTSKALRIIAPPEQTSEGRWRIRAEEYDPAAYSDQVITQPSSPDTTAPVNAPPAAPTALTIGETTYQLQNGNFASRLDITWERSQSAYVTGYSVKVFEGQDVVWATVVDSTSVSTSPLTEQVGFRVEVSAQTALFVGDAIAADYTIIGKTAIPDPPAEVSGFEAGGEVRLRWPASTDVDAQRYEVRYGPTTGSWETAEALDIVDGLRLVTKDVPPSENQPGAVWRFYVKTIDSIRQRSTTAATVDISVTQDNDAFTAGTVSPITVTASSAFLHETVEDLTNGKTQLYVDGGQTWADLFGAAPMSSFTQPLASYQTPPGTAEWYSEELALLTDRGGNWLAEAPSLVEFAGAATIEMGLRPDGGSYGWGPLSQRLTARYAQVRVLSPGLFKLELPSGSIRADVIAVEEVGSDVSLASGGKTVSLSTEYAETRSVVITPEGTASRTAVVDNIIVGGASSFDVYIFDANNNQVATPFRWTYKGV
ncbi:MAG: phage tail protein [Pseudomonadota bacterium]